LVNPISGLDSVIFHYYYSAVAVCYWFFLVYRLC
jgi:hypothetical protein